MTIAPVLVVDDNEENRYLMEVLFKAHGFTVSTASNGAEALKQARENPPMLIVSDILMPVMDGFALCRAWKQDQQFRHIPFIFYTATYTDDKDRTFALSLGAEKFIVKPEEPDLLMAAIRETIQQVENPSSTKPTPNESGPDEVAQMSAHGNDTVYLKQYNEALIRKLENKMEQLELMNKRLTQDITKRKQAEEDLNLTNKFLDLIIETIPNMVFLKEAESLRFVRINRAGEELLGYSRDEMVGKTDHDLFPKEQADAFVNSDRYVLMGSQEIVIAEEPVQTREKGIRILHTRKVPILGQKGEPEFLLGISEDITEQNLAEKERDELQMQLIQAQKMESIGRLAGGVAHDFNNKLFVIMSHAELLLADLPSDSPSRQDLEKIFDVAQSSADLTRQLLAFARRQTVTPKTLDLNKTITSVLKMIGRLIGDAIELDWKPAQKLKPVVLDPTQIDQLLANLIVNARDAIGESVGKVSIETAAVRFDEEYCNNHSGFHPGDYAMIAVRDDGCGMDEETRLKIFEPFFTTKSLGEGTGLGLATVYGIVNQNNGFIHVTSSPGEGSTFRIYLPVDPTSKVEKEQEKPSVARITGGPETVLFVEDDPSILSLGAKILERLDYHVLTASTPNEAVHLAEEHQGEIHLLITDVVMPEMNGKELAERLLTLYPTLKHLFISGYTASVISNQGVLEEGIHFIQKPFTINELSTKVRECLSL